MKDFEVYVTHDNSVAKYVHDDGSETAIKLVKPVQTVINPITCLPEEFHSNRNKYTVFISSSVGCFMQCRFCHLTIKDAKFEKISETDVLQNLMQAIEDMINRFPQMREKYIKLSWMGMGDALNKPDMVRFVSINLLKWALEKGYAKGLDGVDLSTVLPKLVDNSWISKLHQLNEELKQFPRNPAYEMDNVQFSNNQYKKRPPFRLFYSLESANQATRDFLVPNAMPLIDAVSLFQEYCKNSEDHVFILHHMLIEGLNDSEKELSELISFMSKNFPNNELRLLRYNFCAKSPMKESDLFLRQVQKLANSINFLKVQVSPGSEVSAACGQFIVKIFRSMSQLKN